MGLRGPQPKPRKLRELEGNPGKRSLNPREPEPRGHAVRPEFVTGAAAEEWDRCIASMPPGFFTEADVAVLAIYCLTWVTYRNALAQIAREGMTAKGAAGQNVAHPMLQVAAKQAEVVLKTADRLGMSPAARTRLDVGEKEVADPFAGLIGPSASYHSLSS